MGFDPAEVRKNLGSVCKHARKIQLVKGDFSIETRPGRGTIILCFHTIKGDGDNDGPRVLLADDHRIVAEGLRSLIEPEFELVGIVEDGRALIEATERLRPDVIVADISMPLLNGIEAMRQIEKVNRDVKVIILTMHSDVTYFIMLLKQELWAMS